jgi:glucose-6-phosphate 1-dehydrogenase
MGASKSKQVQQPITSIAPATAASATATTTTKNLKRTATRLPTKKEKEDEMKATLYLKQKLDIIVLGASGDLAKKKTYPSLYELYASSYLPMDCRIWGYARSNYEINAFHQRLRPYLEKSKDADPEKINNFFKLCLYHQGTGYDDVPSWENLGLKLTNDSNRMFYFALPTSQFGPSGQAIASATGVMVDENITKYWNRFVIEKPFGKDTASSDILAKQLTSLFHEKQLYRIDHYLGKGMVQNILSLRMSNIFFNKLWNKDSISSVAISWKENIGTMGRGGYFDDSGIIRDVMQNHLLQVLSIVAMNEPNEMTATSIRNEKTKILQAIQPIELEDIILGQYTKGMIPGNVNEEPGYREDATVPSDSITPTYCLAKFTINNERWKGVRSYIFSRVTYFALLNHFCFFLLLFFN